MKNFFDKILAVSTKITIVAGLLSALAAAFNAFDTEFRKFHNQDKKDEATSS